jgi:hypothetical protein
LLQKLTLDSTGNAGDILALKEKVSRPSFSDHKMFVVLFGLELGVVVMCVHLVVSLPIVGGFDEGWGSGSCREAAEDPYR